MQEPATSRKKKKPEIQEKDLHRLKVLGAFRKVLSQAIESSEVKPHRSFEDKRRRLELGDYLSLFLMGLFNPVARTVRGLVQASKLPKVRSGVCKRPVSLGSFSETQALVEPELLQRVFESLAAEVLKTKKPPGSGGGQRWLARDSSLFAALPRMAWALYGGGREGCTNNAVRLHVSFDLSKDAPAQVSITPGKTCERAALRKDLRPGDGYVGDRYYGEHYAFFEHLSAKGCKYLVRILDKNREPLIEEELPVSAEDAAQKVERQAWVRLGSDRTRSERLRLIWVRSCRGELLLLVTNLSPEELSAADAALLYKERWQVEYFFRWIKCLLAEDHWHWLAESPKGVAIQLYLTLIASLLLQLDLGRRPSKRVWELYQWYNLGMIDEEELATMLAEQLASEARIRELRAKKKSASKK